MLRRRTFAALCAIATALTAGCTSDERPARWREAQPASEFVASVAVNTRTAFHGTTQDDYGRIRLALDQLGVRHIRDGLWPAGDPQHAFYRRLADAGFIATLGLCDLNDATVQRGGRRRFDPKCLSDKLDLIRRDPKLRKLVVALENVNEPDTFSPFPGWPEQVRRYQQALARVTRDDPAWKGVELVGPSFATPEGPEQVGDLSRWLDHGNIHPYEGGAKPGTSLDYNLGQCAAVAGSKPCEATESGYHAAIRTTSPHSPASETAMGTYVPRMVLEYFRRGVARTHIYTLVDQVPDGAPCRPLSDLEGHFGLYDCRWRPKPSAKALGNLLHLLAPRGDQPRDPGGLSLAIDENPRGDVRSLLLSNRAWYDLVLWRDVSVWDRAARVDLNPAPERVTVRLRPANVVRYDPAHSTESVEDLGHVTQLPVELAGEPVVLRITP